MSKSVGSGGILRIHLQSPEPSTSKPSSSKQIQEAHQFMGNGVEGIQHHIQQCWSSFGMMSEVQRAKLLEGILERCSNREVDYICRLLNFKLAENSQVPVYIPTSLQGTKQFFNSPVSGKKGDQLVKFENQSSFPVHAPQQQSKSHRKSLGGQNQIMNSNMYAKLIDSNYDPNTLIDQYRNASSTDLLRGIEFVSKRCSTFRNSMLLIQKVWEQSDVPGSLSVLVNNLANDLKIKYVSVYEFDDLNGDFKLHASNWKSDISSLGTRNIIHASTILQNKEQHVSYGFRKSDEFTEDIEARYPKDIDYVMSIPIASKKTGNFGILEVINRTTSSQFIGDDEELVLSAYVGVIGLMLDYQIGQTNLKHLKDSFSMLMNAIDVIVKNDSELFQQTESILKCARTLIKSDRCNYYNIDFTKNELVPFYSSEPIKFSIPMTKESLVSVCATKGKPVKEKSIPANSQFYDRRTDYRTTALLAVPVVGETGKQSGVLEFLNKTTKLGVFSSSDESLALNFSRMITSLRIKTEMKKKLDEATRSATTASALWEFYKKTTPDVIISIDGFGKTVAINNPKELGMSDQYYRKIKDSSYILWMGEPNVALVNDIRRCLQSNESVSRSRYTLTVDGAPLICNYTAIKINEKMRYEPNVVAYVIIQVYKENTSASPEPEPEDDATKEL